MQHNNFFQANFGTINYKLNNIVVIKKNTIKDVSKKSVNVHSITVFRRRGIQIEQIYIDFATQWLGQLQSLMYLNSIIINYISSIFLNNNYLLMFKWSHQYLK